MDSSGEGGGVMGVVIEDGAIAGSEKAEAAE